MTDMLFDGYPDPERPPELTTGQKIRNRQQKYIDQGVHPLSRLKLAGNGHTCADCVHRILVGGHAKSYPKCDQTSMSNSETSDCRAWWPACTAWTPRQENE